MAGVTFPKELMNQHNKNLNVITVKIKTNVNTQKIYWRLRVKLMNLK